MAFSTYSTPDPLDSDYVVGSNFDDPNYMKSEEDSVLDDIEAEMMEYELASQFGEQSYDMEY